MYPWLPIKGCWCEPIAKNKVHLGSMTGIIGPGSDLKLPFFDLSYMISATFLRQSRSTYVGISNSGGGCSAPISNQEKFLETWS